MRARISQDGTVVGPLLASLGEIQEAKNSTDVPEVLAQGGKTDIPRKPILISVGIGGTVAGIGLFLSTRVTVSRSAP
jgi:alkyl hydroperoxide reductase subunit AhpF